MILCAISLSSCFNQSFNSSAFDNSFFTSSFSKHLFSTALPLLTLAHARTHIHTQTEAMDRVKLLEEENVRLKLEVDALKFRVKFLLEENKKIRSAYVNIQARAEQEEEFISNTLLKQIESLKKEKETIALKYEQEEECLTNDLNRKLNQLLAEKAELEKSYENKEWIYNTNRFLWIIPFSHNPHFASSSHQQPT